MRLSLGYPYALCVVLSLLKCPGIECPFLLLLAGCIHTLAFLSLCLALGDSSVHWKVKDVTERWWEGRCRGSCVLLEGWQRLVAKEEIKDDPRLPDVSISPAYGKAAAPSFYSVFFVQQIVLDRLFCARPYVRNIQQMQIQCRCCPCLVQLGGQHAVWFLWLKCKVLCPRSRVKLPNSPKPPFG